MRIRGLGDNNPSRRSSFIRASLVDAQGAIKPGARTLASNALSYTIIQPRFHACGQKWGKYYGYDLRGATSVLLTEGFEFLCAPRANGSNGPKADIQVRRAVADSTRSVACSSETARLGIKFDHAGLLGLRRRDHDHTRAHSGSGTRL